jgi:hypothetical protein
VSEGKVGVDIVPALPLASSEVEGLAQGRPDESRGTTAWIRPVNVLRLRSAADGRRFLVATAIVPSTATQLKGVAVAQRVDGNVVRVDVGRDQLTWRCGTDGCEFRGVVAR